jgi:hypothetical protein
MTKTPHAHDWRPGEPPYYECADPPCKARGKRVRDGLVVEAPKRSIGERDPLGTGKPGRQEPSPAIPPDVVDSYHWWVAKRLTAERAAYLLQSWMDPETAPLIRSVYVILYTEFDQIKVDLTARTSDEWASLESADLVRLALTALCVREGIEMCLPPDFDFTNDPWLRRFLYWCLVLGHAQAAAADDPLELVAGAMQYELLDPYVRAEITRRGVQHPAGMHAWMLANALRTEPAGPAVERELEHLRKLAWRPMKRRDVLSVAKQYLPTGQPEDNRSLSRDVTDTLTSNIVFELDRRAGARHLIDVITRALDGKLNILPRAVYDTTLKWAASELRDTRRKDANADPDLYEVPDQQVLEGKEWAPDQHLVHDEQLTRLQNVHPRLPELAREDRSDRPRHKATGEIADQLGVTPQRVGQIRKKLEEDLQG